MKPEPPQPVADHIDRFTGRTWLLPVVSEWFFEKPNERMFILTGGPGTGKSMVMAWLAGYGHTPGDPTAQVQLERLHMSVKAAHFCQAASRNISPHAFAESIAGQLIDNVNGFRDVLMVALDDRVQINVNAHQTIVKAARGAMATNVSINFNRFSDESGFDRAFALPLKKLYENGYNQPILLLVDALDEALNYTGVSLPDLLSRLSDLPAPVRILVTTRDEPRVLKFFRGIEPFDLIGKAPQDADDVGIYVAQRIIELASINETKRNDFAHRLSIKAGGVFLYAALVLEELLARSSTELPDLDAYHLPDTLSGLYHDFLTRELGRNEQKWDKLYEPLLGLIAVASGEGVSAGLLTAIIRKDIKAPLRTCKQYLNGDLPDGPFRPFHKSFSDFLLEDKSNIDYHIEALKVHRRIADHLWKNHHDDWSTCDAYALNSLAIHLYNAQEHEKLVSLINEEWMHARVAGDGYRYDGFIADIMIAWQSAREMAKKYVAVEKPSHAEVTQGESAIAECLRLALLRTSINSLSQNYPPQILAQAVKKGLWKCEQALSYVANAYDPKQRVETYLAILKTNIPVNAQYSYAVSSCLESIKSMEKAENRIRIFCELIPYLLGEQREHAYDMVVTFDNNVKPKLLLALAQQWNGEPRIKLLEEAMEAALVLDEVKERVYVLLEIVLCTEGDLKTTIINKALNIALCDIVDTIERAHALAAVVRFLSGDSRIQIIEKIHEAIRGINDVKEKVHALGAMVELVEGDSRIKILQEGFVLVSQINFIKERIYGLRSIVQHLEDMWVNKAVEIAHTIIPNLEGEVLIAAGCRIPWRDKIDILRDTSDKIRNEIGIWYLTQFLTECANEELLLHVLQQVKSCTNPWFKIEGLAFLAHKLSGSDKKFVLDQAEQVLELITTPRYVAWAIELLAPVGGDEILSHLVSSSLKLPPDERYYSLNAIAPQLYAEQLENCIKALTRIEREPLSTLARLTQYRSDDLSFDDIETICSLQEKRSFGIFDYLDFTTHWGARFQGELQHRLLSKAFQSIITTPQYVTSEQLQTLLSLMNDELLISCIDKLPGGFDSVNISVAYPIIQRIVKSNPEFVYTSIKLVKNTIHRILLLAHLANHTHKSLKKQDIESVLSLALQIPETNISDRAYIFVELSKYVDWENHRVIVSTAFEMILKMPHDKAQLREGVLLYPFVEAEQEIVLRKMILSHLLDQFLHGWILDKSNWIPAYKNNCQDGVLDISGGIFDPNVVQSQARRWLETSLPDDLIKVLILNCGMSFGGDFSPLRQMHMEKKRVTRLCDVFQEAMEQAFFVEDDSIRKNALNEVVLKAMKLADSHCQHLMDGCWWGNPFVERLHNHDKENNFQACKISATEPNSNNEIDQPVFDRDKCLQFIDALWDHQGKTCADLLNYTSETEILSEPILGKETFVKMTHAVCEVCERWKWM